jgi:hypothetical protein
MNIEPYHERDAGLWDNFILESNNGTLFHMRKFIGYHPSDRFKDHSLMFLKKGSLIALLPAADVQTDSGRLLISHPGSSMGSLVVPSGLAFADAEEIVETFIAYAKSAGFNGIRLTPPPMIYLKSPSEYINFCLMSKGFEYVQRNVTSVIGLASSEELILDQFKPTHRTAVRKAEKSGVKIRQSNDWDTFYAILEKNLSIRHDVSPTHSLKELKALAEIFPDKIILFGAYLGDDMIAGVVNFIVKKDVALAFYISHDESFQEHRPINLLFYSIFSWAIKNGIRTFDFGTFTVDGEPNRGLARFKENFGASGVFRDTIQIQLF